MSQKRSYEHVKSQREIKQIDKCQCAICKKIGNDMAGHHLIPYSEAGSPNIINFITLCTSCHRKYHNKSLHVDIYRF